MGAIPSGVIWVSLSGDLENEPFDNGTTIFRYTAHLSKTSNAWVLAVGMVE